MKSKRHKRINWVEGIHYRRIDPDTHSGMKYEMLVEMYHRGKHGRIKTIPQGRQSDGATRAKDLCPEAFFTHDEFCIDPYWDDGTPITNWEASREYRKILKRYGYSMRGWVRHYATFLFGGGRIKKQNGWIFNRGAKRVWIDLPPLRFTPNLS